MNLVVSDSYESMSKQAAGDLLKVMASAAAPLICLASGDTPAGLCQQLVEQSNGRSLNLSSWYYVGLDEWVGMNGTNEGSCRDYLDRQLFHPLHIPEDRICFFDGKAEDLQNECKMTDGFIQRHGGIKVCVLGLGLNGHVGMNEPGSSPDLYSHIVELDPLTVSTGQKYFKTTQDLSLGITLGISSILESENVYLLVSGKKKAGIVKKVIEGEITKDIPASLLRLHSKITIFLDKDAASMLANV